MRGILETRGLDGPRSGSEGIKSKIMIAIKKGENWRNLVRGAVLS